MREYLSKIWKISLLSLSLAGGMLHADAMWYGGECGNCYPSCCQDSGAFSFDRFAIRAEGLYWRASEDNLAFAQRELFFESDCSKDCTERFEAFIKKEELDFRWKPGFRLTLEYFLPCDCWDTQFVWTHLNNHASDSANSPNSCFPSSGPNNSATVLIPTFLPFLDGDLSFFNHINAHWDLQFNNFEWNIGRHICFSSCFDVRPYIGFKWERFKQKFDINYLVNRTSSECSSEEVFGTIKQEFKTDFSGFGLQGGFDANWGVGCGFSIFSNVSGGLACGRARVHEDIIGEFHFEMENHNGYKIANGSADANYADANYDGGENLESSYSSDNGKNPHHSCCEEIETFAFKFRDRQHVVRPNIDLSIGLRWEYLLCNCYEVSLQVAWEFHHFWDQNFFRAAQDFDPARGSLTLYGVTFGGGIRF